MQILINILITSFYLILISLSFLLIYFPTKFFNLSHAATITLAPYLVFLFSIQFGFDIVVACSMSIFITVIFSVLTETLLFRPLRFNKASPLILLISSLGLYIIIENLISLIWGNSILSIRDANIVSGYSLFGAHITSIQVTLIFTSVVIFILIIGLLNNSSFGKETRAISSNQTLAIILGIKLNKVILVSYVLGSFVAAIAGILIAIDTNLSPDMGFNLLLLAVVAMIIGGFGSIKGIFFGAFLLATAQHIGAYYIDSKWMNTIAYTIFILFLIWKPLGLSGKQLKKVEI